MKIHSGNVKFRFGKMCFSMNVSTITFRMILIKKECIEKQRTAIKRLCFRNHATSVDS